MFLNVFGENQAPSECLQAVLRSGTNFPKVIFWVKNRVFIAIPTAEGTCKERKTEKMEFPENRLSEAGDAGNSFAIAF